MVAGLVFLRLRSVLGRRTGNERPPNEAYGDREAKNGDDNVIQMPGRGPADAKMSAEQEAELWSDDSPVGAGLTQIKIADHKFEPGEFLNGARMAYEMIVVAFAEGDRKTLRGLLNDEVYENFDKAIGDRETRRETQETSIVDIKSADIVDARMNDTVAEVTVKLISETISVVKDADGEPLDPNATQAREITDIWTFSRDTRHRDPNWLLIETRSQS